jgi:hypothetical protein
MAFSTKNQFLQKAGGGKKSYGLIIPKKKKTTGLKKGLLKHNAFSFESAPVSSQGGRSGINASLADEKSKGASLRHVQSLHKKALEEDASVFDYDGVYDAIAAGACALCCDNPSLRLYLYPLCTAHFHLLALWPSCSFKPVKRK